VCSIIIIIIIIIINILIGGVCKHWTGLLDYWTDNNYKYKCRPVARGCLRMFGRTPL